MNLGDAEREKYENRLELLRIEMVLLKGGKRKEKL